MRDFSRYGIYTSYYNDCLHQVYIKLSFFIIIIVIYDVYKKVIYNEHYV